MAKNYAFRNLVSVLLDREKIEAKESLDIEDTSVEEFEKKQADYALLKSCLLVLADEVDKLDEVLEIVKENQEEIEELKHAIATRVV